MKRLIRLIALALAVGMGACATSTATGSASRPSPAKQGAGKTLEAFYAAVERKDVATARHYLDPNLTFYGLFETYRSADEYLTALTGLLSITARLNVLTIVAQGEDAVVFFELETSAPAAATTLVAEWHKVRGGKIVQVRSAFDGRPFEAMFTRRY